MKTNFDKFKLYEENLTDLMTNQNFCFRVECRVKFEINSEIDLIATWHFHLIQSTVILSNDEVRTITGSN